MGVGQDRGQVSLLLQETVSESVYDKHRLQYRPFQTRLPPVSRQSARQRHIWRDALQAQGKDYLFAKASYGCRVRCGAVHVVGKQHFARCGSSIFLCGCHGLFRRRFRRSVRPVQMRFHQHIRQDALSVAFGRSRHGHTFVYGHTVGVRPRGGRLHAHVRRGPGQQLSVARDFGGVLPRHTHRRGVRFR